MGYDLVSHNKTGDYSNVKPEDGYIVRLENLDGFRFSINVFPMVLDLAEVNGWEPEGTSQPPWWNDPEMSGKNQGEWEGRYLSNEGQSVSETDALKLADALEKSLDDIPDHDDLPDKLIRLKPGDDTVQGRTSFEGFIDKHFFDQGFELITANVGQGVLQYFGGSQKNQLVDFIKFCRKGGFSIW